MQTLTVHLYANLKEKAGTDILFIEAPDRCSVNDLKNLLKQSVPALAFQLNKVVFTVNGGQVYITDEILPQGADINLLPPFGGG